MKKLSIVAPLVVSLGLLSAVTANAVEGIATVQIVDAIAITAVNPLSFGQIIAGSGASSITLGLDNQLAVTGTAVLAGGTHSLGSFDVTGGFGTHYTVTLPATATLYSGTDLLSITSFSSNPSAGAGVLDSSGEQTVFVGGVLLVPVAVTTPTGLYSGVFDVTVAYN